MPEKHVITQITSAKITGRDVISVELDQKKDRHCQFINILKLFVIMVQSHDGKTMRIEVKKT